MLRYKLGRFLQVVGMLIVPNGMAGNVLYKESITEKHVLGTACGGLLLFGIGTMIQGRARGN
jgi:hypothetical protein